MLGLAEQVDSDQFGVDAVVADHHGLGRAGEQVDADAAIQLALGFGDEGVARADDHVDAGDALGADGHRRHRLHAAEAVDFIGAGQVHGGDDLGAGLALERRRGGDHPLDPGDLGGEHAHVRAGDQRVLAAGDVATDRVDRDVAVAEHHARQGLDFDVVHRVLLDLREAADLRLGELDVVEGLLRQAGDAGVDLRLAEAEGFRRPVVELR
ncbi:hypothetical protein D9M68_191340 [compost metagenome]